MRICKVKNCNNKYDAKGYCSKHYYQIKKYGKILERCQSDKNEIIDCGDYCEICIYNIKHKEIARAKIDKEDLNKVKNYKWHLFKSKGYVNHSGYINKIQKNIRLHQLILGKKQGFIIDHINHDKLDNRKKNLRFVTYNQNQWNRKAKGYDWHKKNKCWVVRITRFSKVYHIGCYKTENEAIKVRKKCEKQFFGEFAQNF